jgi:hypothetical protein
MDSKKVHHRDTEAQSKAQRKCKTRAVGARDEALSV